MIGQIACQSAEVTTEFEPTLSLIVGLSWMKRNRFATTGNIHNMVVRKMVSHTLGWFSEFLAVPEKD